MIDDFNPKVIIGGIGDKINITGTGFGNIRGTNFVSFMQGDGNYMNSSDANNLNYINWSDTEIIVEMPYALSYEFQINITGTVFKSNTNLYVIAGLDNRTTQNNKSYLINQNGLGGYTWYIHETFYNNPVAKGAIEEVFIELRRVTGVNFILSNIPTTDTPSYVSGINIIAPDTTINGGYHYLQWEECVHSKARFYYTKRMNIGLSPTINWYYGKGNVPMGHIKFRHILLHELGHAVGLGHVRELDQTMYPFAHELPSNNRNGRDNYTSEEIAVMSHYVKLSQGINYFNCGITPLKPFTDYTAIY